MSERIKTLSPGECPNCGRLHPQHNFMMMPGPVQVKLSKMHRRAQKAEGREARARRRMAAIAKMAKDFVMVGAMNEKEDPRA
jgi:hypothetical protein